MEKEIETQSIPAWEIPWQSEPGGLGGPESRRSGRAAGQEHACARAVLLSWPEEPGGHGPESWGASRTAWLWHACVLLCCCLFLCVTCGLFTFFFCLLSLNFLFETIVEYRALAEITHASHSSASVTMSHLRINMWPEPQVDFAVSAVPGPGPALPYLELPFLSFSPISDSSSLWACFWPPCLLTSADQGVKNSPHFGFVFFFLGVLAQVMNSGEDLHEITYGSTAVSPCMTWSPAEKAKALLFPL